MKKYILFFIGFLLSFAALSQGPQKASIGVFTSFKLGTANTYTFTKGLAIGADTGSAATKGLASIKALNDLMNYKIAVLYNNLTGNALTTLSATATLDFPSTDAQSTSGLAITVTGAAVNDVVALGYTVSATTGQIWTAYVSSANTVMVVFLNSTGVAVNPPSGTFKVTVLK